MKSLNTQSANRNCDKIRYGLILTHGLELSDELFLGPFGPLFLICVDGAQDGSTRFPTILYGGHVQVVDQHNVGVLKRARTEIMMKHFTK